MPMRDLLPPYKKVPTYYDSTGKPNRAYVVAIEGADGVGKSTQVDLISREVIKHSSDGFHSVIRVPFPEPDHVYYGPIREMLRSGRVKKSPFLLQAMMTGNRLEWQARTLPGLLRSTDLILTDRSALSGVVYGLASGLEINDVLDLMAPMFMADLTFVLDGKPHKQSSPERAALDSYDTDRSLQARVRELYQEASKESRWLTDKQMVSIRVVDANQLQENVTNEIYGAIVDAKTALVGKK